MDLLNHCSKQCMDALVNQTLHVVHSFLIRQVQTELILHLERTPDNINFQWNMSGTCSAEKEST